MTSTPDRKTGQTLLAWAALLCCAALAFLFLVNALFGIRAADGMPGPHASVWMRQAWEQGSFSAGAFFLGCGLFRGIRRFPLPGRVTVALFLAAFLFAAAPYAGRLLVPGG